MYTSYFDLKENPFNLTPDPRYLFLSPHHREALDHLLYGINERKGFIAITGGIGTGKTTLCRALLSQLDESTKSALIFNSFITEKELLEIINLEFGIDLDTADGTKKEYIDKLNQFLLKTFSLGGNAVLLIDEAQNLSRNVLEQIRMLSNLETEKEKLIQIVLVGQSELHELLATSSLRQLNERIMVRYDLKPLDRKDVQGYIEHRLVVAGGRGNLKFTKGAFQAIYSYSNGNPRRINAVCDRSLLISYAQEKYTISKEIVKKAIKELHGDMTVKLQISGWTWKRITSLTILLLLLILVAGFAGWSFRKPILGLFPVEEKMTVVKNTFRPPEPKKEAGILFLDEKTSLASLFDLFNSERSGGSLDLSESHLGVVTFNIDPKHLGMFKKPFRMHLSDSTSIPFPRYLLIRKITENGAIAVDTRGKERAVTRDFILKNWARKVSWVYLHINKNINLVKGMSVPAISKIQRMLNNIGYPVELTGIYDETTFYEVMKFQRDFGLLVDGIVGPRTRALLSQMSD